MAKYHINPHSQKVGECKAKIKCAFNLTEHEHFSSRREAENFIVKNLQESYENFSTPIDTYGVTYKKPKSEDFYESEEDGTYYRSELLYSLYGDYNDNDFQIGYKIPLNLNSLQKFLSKQIVDNYRNMKNPFKIDNLDSNSLTVPLVAIIDDELFIAEGNHRFAAAKERNMTAWGGIVVEVTPEGTRLVKPDEFNSRF